MIDPIADMLTRLRNAISRKHEKVEFPFSKIKEDILKVLKDNERIESYEVVNVNKSGSKKDIVVQLKYYGNKPAISELKKISKPGKRVYASYRELPVIKNNYGFVIISTSQGVIDSITARKEKIGGEIMCEIF
jgi:small subunit ribosomal protein S8